MDTKGIISSAQKSLEDKAEITKQKLDKILKEDGFALLPIMQYKEHGIYPSFILKEVLDESSKIIQKEKK